MLLLAVESSCDDTSAAVLDGRRLKSNVVTSQDSLHADYGGVVPELAARRHLESIDAVIASALDRAGVELCEIEAIAVTRGPGLVGSLLVGMAAAQGLGLRLGVPVTGVHHLEGHVLSPLMDSEIQLPLLAMVVSGGHTAVYLLRDIGDYAELASTRDDSAGEAFDKGAKMLGLGYPGGKIVDEMAARGDSRAFRFPRAVVKADPWAFSFSGLKTALWNQLGELHGASRPSDSLPLADICASFQEAIVDVLVDRIMSLALRLEIPRLAVAGGVSANSRLRERMKEACDGAGFELAFPSMPLCTDNAGMIGYAAQRRLELGLPGQPLAAVSRLPLGPVLRP